MDFEHKYLKYKLKYNILKNIVNSLNGGGDVIDVDLKNVFNIYYENHFHDGKYKPLAFNDFNKEWYKLHESLKNSNEKKYKNVRKTTENTFTMANFNILYGLIMEKDNNFKYVKEECSSKIYANFLNNKINSENIDVISLQEVLGEKETNDELIKYTRVDGTPHIKATSAGETNYFNNWYKTFTENLEDNIGYKYFNPSISSFYENKFGNMVLWNKNKWSKVKCFHIPEILDIPNLPDDIKEKLNKKNLLTYYGMHDTETRSLSGVLLKNDKGQYILCCVTHFTEKRVLIKKFMNKELAEILGENYASEYIKNRQIQMAEITNNVIEYLQNKLNIPVFLGGDFNVDKYIHEDDRIKTILETVESNQFTFSNNYSNEFYSKFSNLHDLFGDIDYNPITSNKQKLVDNIFSTIKPSSFNLYNSIITYSNKDVILSDHLMQSGVYELPDNIQNNTVEDINKTFENVLNERYVYNAFEELNDNLPKDSVFADHSAIQVKFNGKTHIFITCAELLDKTKGFKHLTAETGTSELKLNNVMNNSTNIKQINNLDKELKSACVTLINKYAEDNKEKNDIILFNRQINETELFGLHKNKNFYNFTSEDIMQDKNFDSFIKNKASPFFKDIKKTFNDIINKLNTEELITFLNNINIEDNAVNLMLTKKGAVFKGMFKDGGEGRAYYILQIFGNLLNTQPYGGFKLDGKLSSDFESKDNLIKKIKELRNEYDYLYAVDGADTIKQELEKKVVDSNFHNFITPDSIIQNKIGNPLVHGNSGGSLEVFQDIAEKVKNHGFCFSDTNNTKSKTKGIKDDIDIDNYHKEELEKVLEEGDYVLIMSKIKIKKSRTGGPIFNTQIYKSEPEPSNERDGMIGVFKVGKNKPTLLDSSKNVYKLTDFTVKKK